MAIRKPSYKLAVDPFLESKVMNIIKELDVPKLEVKDGRLYYCDQPIDSLNDDYAVLNTPSHFGLNTPVPSWASEENGCVPHKAIKVGNGIVVEYKPMHTLGIGYAKIYIVGKDDRPFPRMKEIWKETHRIWSKEMKKQHPQTPTEGTIAPTGEIRDQYGSDAPSFDALHKFLLNMNLLYSNWKYFPNVTSYKKVEKLRSALEAVRAMDGSANYIENDIKDLREQIKSRQEEIANREKQLNDLYEKAADAMNLLEENGVKMDAKGKVEGVEDDDSEFISTIDGLPGEYLIDGSSLTPFISTTGKGWSPISICKSDFDKYWADDREYNCATSGH